MGELASWKDQQADPPPRPPRGGFLHYWQETVSLITGAIIRVIWEHCELG